MSEHAKQRVPAVDAWFTDELEPRLRGKRCPSCGTFTFPPTALRCPNPDCGGGDLEDVELSRTGKVWSHTTNHYAPPPPYVAADPFEPFGVAAVELPDERLIVLGQVAGDPGSISVGDDVELVVDTLFEDDEHAYVVWKWRKA